MKIISKIESWHGVTNFDDILAVTGERFFPKNDGLAVCGSGRWHLILLGNLYKLLSYS